MLLSILVYGLAIAGGMRIPALPSTVQPVAHLLVLRGGQLDDALPPADPPSDMRLLEDRQERCQAWLIDCPVRFRDCMTTGKLFKSPYLIASTNQRMRRRRVVLIQQAWSPA
jgi:hypothetical protein